MPTIDYSKWEKLQEDSDDEIFQHPLPPCSPRQPIKVGQFSTVPRLPDNPALRREALREQTQLQNFALLHPCPAQIDLHAWLRRMVQLSRNPHAERGTLAWVMRSMNWNSQHIAWFHYPSFRSLWQSATLTPSTAFAAQRDAGIVLYERGGKPCMQFNFYTLHHVMTGMDFHTGAPFPVYNFTNRIEQVWDGIGSWLA
ncbi:unnamed protein product [Symbiodinium natans]|uniref:Uncharacterized protein n=1 Tax=Symbiodinium natans TaxID=878477 RepID=A0A812KV90_9DINO|nr:unnamed protein product [Symbiodinium natans]